MGPDPLLSWAQDRFLHGHLLAHWITDYVDLEESLAVGSIAQEELAHASVLLELAGYDTAGRDEIIYGWAPGRWSPAELVTRPLDDWPSTVLRGLLMSTAAVALAHWLAGAPQTGRREAGGVLLAEQRLHVTHWERWVLRLGRDPGTGPEMRAAASTLLPMAADLLDGLPTPDPAAALVIRDWAGGTGQILAQAGLPAGMLPSAPRPRRPCPGLGPILGTIRALRTTPADGVVGLYR
jgi:1,2-phenylacetyl-CoA epoxidase catalytic subunit